MCRALRTHVRDALVFCGTIDVVVCADHREPELSAAVQVATAGRSATVTSSQHGLHVCGYFERYALRLDPQWRDTILDAVSGEWLPMDAMVAHYGACDALQLSEEEVARISAIVSDRLNARAVIRFMARSAGSTVTPWFAWERIDRIWSRMWNGSAIRVKKMGPKDAAVGVEGLPLVDIDYFRLGLATQLRLNTELLTRMATVQVLLEKRPGCARYRVSWV